MQTSSRQITEPLVEKLRATEPFDVDLYVKHAAAQLRDGRIERDERQMAAFAELAKNVSPLKKRQMARSRHTGGWLTAYPSNLNDTVLSKEEFCDNLRLRYGLQAHGLTMHCDGCGQTFDVSHALSCAHGGMIHRRHDDIAFKWTGICRQATTYTAVSSEPFIYSGRPTAQSTQQVDQNGSPTGQPDDRGDVAVHSFWKRGYTCIFDVRVMDTDQKSYRRSPPDKVLRRQEDGKKKKYLEACLERRRHFKPLVFSVDGMRGEEATRATKQVARMLAHKWSKGYNQCIQFVRSRLSIALARNVTMCLRGERAHDVRRREFDWGQGASALAIYLD